jgi:hypothetical protein
MVNHEKGATSQEKSMLSSGTSLFIPQRNVGIKDKGINTSQSTVHLRWMTLKRFRRERDLLRCHPCDHFSLTSGTHMTVPRMQLQQPEPSLSTKYNQAGTRIKH